MRATDMTLRRGFAELAPTEGDEERSGSPGRRGNQGEPEKSCIYTRYVGQADPALPREAETGAGVNVWQTQK